LSVFCDGYRGGMAWHWRDRRGWPLALMLFLMALRQVLALLIRDSPGPRCVINRYPDPVIKRKSSALC
jgi:hypothetical protein